MSTFYDLVHGQGSATGAGQHVSERDPAEWLSAGSAVVDGDTAAPENGDRTLSSVAGPLHAAEIRSLGSSTRYVSKSRRDANRRPRSSSMTVRQKFEGWVTAVDDDGFFEAQLVAPDGSEPEFTAELNFDSVSEGDRPLIAPGAAIYLNVGRVEVRPGTSVAFASVHVRRFGRWRADELTFARERAEKRLAAIDFQ